MGFGEYISKLLCEIIPKPSTALDSAQIHPFRVQGQSLSVRKVNPSLPNIKTSSLSLRPHHNGAKKLTTFSTQDSIFKKTQTFNPNVQLSTKEQFYKDMREKFNCGDVYLQCNENADCGNDTYQCYQNQCVPNLDHCINKGCSTEYEECNTETGECDSTRRQCATDDQCAEGFVCEDNECYKEETFCRSDPDCAGVKINGQSTPKCNTETKTCVPCNFGFPSLCAEENPANPSCHILEHRCYPSCDPEVPLERANKYEGGCCSADQVLNSEAKLLSPNRLENCCAKDFNLNWGIDQCCLTPENSGDETGRMCNSWAGKDALTSCCLGYSCNDITGKCE